MQQKNSAASIYHDLQKDFYYKVDKETGRLERSHKNGSPLKSFQLDISGNDYKKRRKNQGSPQRSYMRKKVVDSKLKPMQVASQKIFSPLQAERNQKQQESMRARSIMNSQRMKSQESDANFLTNFNPYAESSSELHGKSHLTSVLKHFSKLNQEKIYQNHSILDKEPGTVINPKVMLNSKGFRETKNTIYQPMMLKRTKLQQNRMASQQNDEPRQDWSHQLSKQKKLFLKFHPHFQQRQNSRLLNEQIDRKKNIKKLQTLFLEQTSKITNQIYS